MMRAHPKLDADMSVAATNSPPSGRAQDDCQGAAEASAKATIFIAKSTYNQAFHVCLIKNLPPTKVSVGASKLTAVT